ncbi:flagellar export apparatus, flagellar assembly protein FliH [Campylobacter sputorum subsp. bovis]|nr:flagellar export apparatus, flagellar assembly protein FliH [Campylobacter sputorum]
MMSNTVISNSVAPSHNIEPYRFKVIGSNLEEEQKASNKKEENSENIAPIESKTIQNEEIVEVSSQTENTPKQNPLEEAHSSFIEELLKRTDELSGNIIKLQMQIENQEKEFEKRLDSEILRAKEDAQKEGYEKAKSEFDIKFDELNAKYLSSISKLESECQNLQNFLATNENELSLAAIDIAKEVIQKEVNANSSIVAQNLAKALMKDIKDATHIELKVNPKDFELMQNLTKEDSKIKITSDDAISPGGVILLSDVGNLDATLQNRLMSVKKIIGE